MAPTLQELLTKAKAQWATLPHTDGPGYPDAEAVWMIGIDLVEGLTDSQRLQLVEELYDHKEYPEYYSSQEKMVEGIAQWINNNIQDWDEAYDG